MALINDGINWIKTDEEGIPVTKVLEELTWAGKPSASAFGKGQAWFRDIGAMGYSDGVAWFSDRDEPKVVHSSVGGVNIATSTHTVPGTFIDPTIKSVFISGGSTSGTTNSGANAVGKNIPANVVAVGTSGTPNNPAETATLSYADYSQVLGYDNIANGKMSIVMGSHDLIYSNSLHASVIGSECVISGTYQATDSSTVIGRQNSINNSSYSIVSGGFKNRIDSTGSANIILGGDSQSISGSAAYCGIIGGSGNTIQGTSLRNFSMGESNTHAANINHASSIGKYLDVKNKNCLVIGGGATTLGAAQTTFSDAVVTTTDATPTYCGSFFTSANQCIAGELQIIGRNVTDTKINRWVIPIIVRVNSAGTAITGSAAVGANVVDATKTFLEDAACPSPIVDLAIGSTIYPKVTGIAGKTFHWRVDFKLSAVI